MSHTWIFPPPGVDVPPLSATGNFGPVRLADTFILNWSPATDPVDIQLTCAADSGAPGIYETALKSITPPISYRYTSSLNTGKAGDRLFYHFSFANSTAGKGNSATWEQITQQASEVKIFSATASSSASSASSSTISLTLTSLVSSYLPTTTSSDTNSNNSGNLTTGAKVGIAVGVTFGVIISALLSYLIFLSLKRRTAKPARPTKLSDEKVKQVKQVKQVTSSADLSSTNGPPMELAGVPPRYELN